MLPFVALGGLGYEDGNGRRGSLVVSIGAGRSTESLFGNLGEPREGRDATATGFKGVRCHNRLSKPIDTKPK